MIKCCQNCHHFRKSGAILRASGICESGELKVITGVEARLTDLLEDGKIHEFLSEEFGFSDDSDGADVIADFFRDHLSDDACVHIRDAQNFCCNAWR